MACPLSTSTPHYLPTNTTRHASLILTLKQCRACPITEKFAVTASSSQYKFQSPSTHRAGEHRIESAFPCLCHPLFPLPVTQATPHDFTSLVRRFFVKIFLLLNLTQNLSFRWQSGKIRTLGGLRHTPHSDRRHRMTLAAACQAAIFSP